MNLANSAIFRQERQGTAQEPDALPRCLKGQLYPGMAP